LEAEAIADAMATPPIQGYCCVNPLLGYCVPRMIPPGKVRATGSGLGCASTRTNCEKSCVLPSETLKTIANTIGYIDQKSLPNLQKSIVSAEARSRFELALRKKDMDIEQFLALLKIVEAAPNSIEGLKEPELKQMNESVSALKKLINLFRRDMLLLGTNVSYDDAFCLYVVEVLFNQLVWMADNTAGTKLPYIRTLLNDMLRSGRVRLHSDRFQKILWDAVLKAIQVWVDLNATERLANAHGPASIGLNALLELAGIEVKPSAGGELQWTRETLATYLLQIGPYDRTRAKTLQDLARLHNYANLAITDLIPTIQSHLSKYKIEAVYRWILEFKWWYIEESALPDDRKLKLTPLSYVENTPFVGDLNDPWWYKALSDRFTSVWKEQDTTFTNQVLHDLAENVFMFDSDERIRKRKTLKLKHEFLVDLVKKNGVDLTDVDSIEDKNEPFEGVSITLREIMDLNTRLYYASILESAIRNFKKSQRDKLAAEKKLEEEKLKEEKLNQQRQVQEQSTQIMANGNTVVRSVFGLPIIPSPVMQFRAATLAPAAATFFVPGPPQASKMDMKSGGYHAIHHANHYTNHSRLFPYAYRPRFAGLSIYSPLSPRFPPYFLNRPLRQSVPYHPRLRQT
jgi:hypothetical protein